MKGLNQTNMDNRFAFGLWIFLDLTVIALGAGAFFTGFLLYILKMNELRSVINSAVVIGLVCYSGAMGVLAVDVGPAAAFLVHVLVPQRSLHADGSHLLHQLLSDGAADRVPAHRARNRKLREVPSFLVFEHELHKLIYVLAGVGTFLSFFHQGSLGGLYGVLRGRPFAFREGLAVWPSTFFLFILSAAAVGPSFILLTTWLVEKISRKRLVRPEVLQRLGRISGPAAGGLRAGQEHRHAGLDQPHFARDRVSGVAILQLETVRIVDPVRGNRRVRAGPGADSAGAAAARAHGWLVTAAAMACCGVALNRFVMTVQTLALPTFSFDRFLSYTRAGRRRARSWRWWRTGFWFIRFHSAISSCSRRSANSEWKRRGAGRENW